MTTIEALSAKRRNYIEAARDNGFEEGLRTLLADLYPDNAHFIYELLQNAEDAGAREVTFDLQPTASASNTTVRGSSIWMTSSR